MQEEDVENKLDAARRVGRERTSIMNFAKFEKTELKTKTAKAQYERAR